MNDRVIPEASAAIRLSKWMHVSAACFGLLLPSWACASETSGAWTLTGTPFVDARTATSTMPVSGLATTASFPLDAGFSTPPVYQSQPSSMASGGIGTFGSNTFPYRAVDAAGVYQSFGAGNTFPTVAGGLGIQTIGGLAACTRSSATAATTDCGRFVVTFAQPVRNPTFHFVQMGGTAGTVSFNAAFDIVAPPSGATPSWVPAAVNSTPFSMNMVVTSVRAGSAVTVGAACNGTAADPDGTQSAVCGSASLVGTNTVFQFNLLHQYYGTGVVSTNDGFRLQVTVDSDFGDAPASYDGGQTTSHVLSDLALGSTTAISAELRDRIVTATTASPNAGASASGDTDNALATVAAVSDSAATYSVTVPVSGVSKSARLCGYIDFNRDGDFGDASERACANVAAGATSAGLTWTLPSGAAYVAGNSYLRLRLGYTTAQIESPTGGADSGEIEDYPIVLATSTDLSVTKTNGQTTYQPGQWVTYTIVVSNAGPASGNGTIVTDPVVSDLFFQFISCSAAGGAVCPASTIAALQGGGITIATLPAGGSVTFTLNGVMRANAISSITNTAALTIPSGVTDSNPANNTASDTDSPIPPTLTSCPLGNDYMVWSSAATSGTGAVAGTTATLIPALPNVAFTVTGAAGSSAAAQAPETMTDISGMGNGWVGLFGDASGTAGTTNLRTSLPGGSSGASLAPGTVETFTFATPTQPNSWGFMLADVDNEQVQISATDANGNAISAAVISSWYRGVYDAVGASIELPRWLGPSEPWIMGSGVIGAGVLPPSTHLTNRPASASDNDKSSIWFTPNVAIKTLTITYQNTDTSTSSERLYMASCLVNKPTLTLNKTTVNGVGGPFGFALTNTAQATGTVTTTVANTATQVDGNTGTAGVQDYGVSAINTAVTINENTLPAGWSLTNAACTKAGNAVGSLTGSTYTIPATDVVAGAAFVCNFNNSLAPTDLSITKTDNQTQYAPGQTLTYSVVVGNAGPGPGDNAVFTDPAVAGLTVNSVACGSAANGAACPTVANTTVALMQGAGIVIPTLPATGSVTFTVTATVNSGTTGNLTNTANIAAPAGVTDSNTGNNSAADTDTGPVTGPLSCSANTMYSIDQSTRVLSVLNPVSGTNSTITTLPLPPGGVAGTTFLNAMGIPPGGGNQLYVAIASNSPAGMKGAIYTYNTVTATGTYSAAPAAADVAPYAGNFVAGAVNPANGWFYYATAQVAAGSNTVWGLFAYNPATGAAPIRVGEITSVNGNNGDLAFDALGNLYLLSGNLNFAVYRVNGPMPTTSGSGNLPATVITPTFNVNVNFGGIAFNNGLLVTQAGASYYQFDPATGAQVGGPVTSVSGGDLASCGYPNTIRLQKNLPGGRAVATDQFGLAITGGGIATGNTATTTSTTDNLQTPIAGAVLGQVGTTYTITETTSGGTNFANYTSTWQCVDATNGNASIASGTGTSGSFVMPNGGNEGVDALCTVTNVLSAADLTITKTNTPGVNGDVDQPADTVAQGSPTTYTIKVTNNGPASVTGAIVKDTAVSGLACPVGNAVTCTGTGCPAGPITIANLQSGLTLGTLTATAPGNTVSLVFSCNVP